MDVLGPGIQISSCEKMSATGEERSQEVSDDLTSERINDDIILVVAYKKRKMAAVKFNPILGELSILTSTDDGPPDYAMLQRLTRQISPEIVIADSQNVNAVRNAIAWSGAKVEKLHWRLFDYAEAKTKVFSIKMKNQSGDSNKMRILSSIDFSDERLVSALGALVSFGREIKVEVFNFIRIDDFTLIDEETYFSLQIFDQITHSSSFKWRSNDKVQGVSLYHVFEKHSSALGLTKLRSLMTQPTNNIELLGKRHQVLTFYGDAKNRVTMEKLKSNVLQLSQLTTLKKYVNTSLSKNEYWTQVYRNIYYATLYAEVCRDKAGQIPYFNEVAGCLNDSIYSLAQNIDRVIDFEYMNGPYVVKPGFYEPLDNAKVKLKKLKELMNKITPFDFDSVPTFVRALRMIYIPEMKFLLWIPFWKENPTDEDLSLDGLELKFVANGAAYYKSKRCLELDEILGDPQTYVIQEEKRILKSLLEFVQQNIRHVYILIDKIAELESLFALAKAAVFYHYTCPVLGSDRVINIVNGRHPLMSLLLEDYITNNFTSSPNDGLVHTLHGPNGSGKTLYLKQTALIVYMAHIGSFVPAEHAVIELLTLIHARFHKNESVLAKSSGLMNEIAKIAEGINNSRPDSLIIFDELGCATAEMDSTALVGGCVQYFIKLKAESPHLILSTHLNDFRDLLDDADYLSLHVMDYTVDEGDLVFLYKAKKGDKDTQLIFEVVEACDHRLPLIDTAKLVLNALRTGVNHLPVCNLRTKRALRYMNFLRRFATIDFSKEGYVDRFRTKVQRFVENINFKLD